MYLKYGLNICFDVINVYRVIELLSLIKKQEVFHNHFKITFEIFLTKMTLLGTWFISTRISSNVLR